MVEVLAKEERLYGLRLTRAVPELVTRLPERAEGRNHDLAIVGQTPREQVTICIEAKADEPFGNHAVREYWDSAISRRPKGKSTRAPERRQTLLEMVGESNWLLNNRWRTVRYQLITALCGTALQAQADGSSLAVLLVHEFRTELTIPENLIRNENNFEEFLSVLSAISPDTQAGPLSGPFVVANTECLIGKAVADVNNLSSR